MEFSARLALVLPLLAWTPVTVDPTPAWTAGGEQQAALLGFAVASAGDVNGDGYSDVLAGAFTFDGANGNNSGRASLWLGAPGGPAAAPDWTADGAAQGEHFGFAVACAGDVNGDGFSDVVVGAPRATNGETNEGRVALFLGSASGPSSTPDWTAESGQPLARFGHSVAAAGDVNGDGYGDVLVGAPFFDAGQEDEGRAFLFLGSAAGLAASPAWTAEGDQSDAELGHSVAPAGDVNGDGFDDVILGARRRDDGELDEGAALVHLGSAAGLGATAAWTAHGNQAGALFGTSVASADVNGDGYGDVVVGASLFDAGEVDEGAAFVYLGSASGLATSAAWTADGDQAGAELGAAVAGAGDVNGDGHGEVLVGAYLHEDDALTDEGEARLYMGTSSGPEASPAWTADADEAGAWFGRAIARAGDVNGDGYGDLLVGAPFRDDGPTDEGWVVLYTGSPEDLADAPGWTVVRTVREFGTAVTAAGDVNGDGHGDVLVGEPSSSNSVVRVYMGSPAGPTPGPVLTEAGVTQALSSAGDLNGDGYDDVIVGDPEYTSSEAWEGRILVYHGSATGLPSTASWIVDGLQVKGFFGIVVSSAGDVNGDGYGDVLAASFHQVTLFFGRAGILPSSSWTSPFSFDEGRGAGDVNGDGYGDILVHPAGAGPIRVYLGSPGGPGTFSDLGGPYWAGPAGDVNGDGFSDVLALGPAAEAKVHLGSGAGLATTAAWTVPASAAARAGDVDGDGYSDVVVGDGGSIHLHLGSASGLATVASWTTPITPLASVSQASDVDGDGYGDLLLGQRSFNGHDGRARIFFGNGGRHGGLVRTLQQRRSDDSARIALHGRSAPDGAFRIRCSFPHTLAGSAWASPAPPLAFLEWEVKPLDVPFDGEGIARSAVGLPLGPAGGTVTFGEEAFAVAPRVKVRDLGAPPAPPPQRNVFRWRARVATNNPLVPRTAWFGMQGNNVTEAKLRRP